EETHVICQDHGEVGADGIEAAMRQIDYAAEGEDQRETERDQQVIRADQKAIQNLLEDKNILHAKNSARKESKQFQAPVNGRPERCGLVQQITRSCRYRPLAEQWSPDPRSVQARRREHHRYTVGCPLS